MYTRRARWVTDYPAGYDLPLSERCLPKEITFAGVKTVCERCQELLSSTDMASLQQDLIKWKPELFANDASADV
jgi:hypothetical protein